MHTLCSGLQYMVLTKLGLCCCGHSPCELRTPPSAPRCCGPGPRCAQMTPRRSWAMRCDCNAPGLTSGWLPRTGCRARWGCGRTRCVPPMAPPLCCRRCCHARLASSATPAEHKLLSYAHSINTTHGCRHHIVMHSNDHGPDTLLRGVHAPCSSCRAPGLAAIFVAL